jgi:glycerate 2-kinase
VRVLISPDDFTGTLTAGEAARAIADGWSRVAPDDQLVLRPLSDGGPGFVTAISAALDAEMIPVGVRGPMGDTAIGVVAMVDRTAYVESAHGCGLALVHPERRDACAATSYGVGQLIAVAIDSGARMIVVGVGGTASTDGGAGMLAALGATASDAVGQPTPLDAGGAALARVAAVDLAPALARLDGVEVIVATDVDAQLLGEQGAARGFAPQKGADPSDVEALEVALSTWADCASSMGVSPDQPGAGAGGGLGLGLMLLGARRVAGVDVVREAVGLDDELADCDLAVTGEGSFDWQSLRGKVITGLAAAASDHAKPLVVLAGRVEVGRREYAALGITEAYVVGQEERVGPAEALARAAARVAAQWSRPGA